MTGIERLRNLAGEWDAWGLGGALADVADEIDRELREALGGEARDPAADVSMSAYDLLPQEDREAIAWVREHGGLERVKAQRRESMPRAAYERKKAGFLDHIAECERALGRRRETISELNRRASDLTRENAELRKRAMPDGMEWLLEAWPKFEDGRPVRFSDDFERYGEENGVSVVTMYSDGSFALNFRAYSKGERVNRPAPKVLDADGAEIREKRDVWWICEGDERGVHAERLRVETICPNGLVECSPYNGGTWVSLEPSELYVNKPVPAADGKPLREGERVWSVNTGELLTVTGFDGDYVKCRYDGMAAGIPEHGSWHAHELTHERPDSWERLEEDATKLSPYYYARDVMGLDTDKMPPKESRRIDMMRDIVRRAKALAERGK